MKQNSPSKPMRQAGEQRLIQALRRHHKVITLSRNQTLIGTILITLERVEHQVNALSQHILTYLLTQIDEHFNDEELRGLCFELGIDYDDLPGCTRSGRARELILCCLQDGRIDQLILAIRQERPQLIL